MKTKTLKITTDDKISVIEVDVNNIKDLQNTIGGGMVEPVRTQKLWDYFKAPVIMLVDEEGLLKDLPMNFFGSMMYGTFTHGCPIVGGSDSGFGSRRTVDRTWRCGFGAVDGEDVEGFPGSGEGRRIK